MSSTAYIPEVSAPATGASATAPQFDLRLAVGLFGVLLAAMTAGLCGRVPALALADIQGAMGASHDDASWLTTFYSAGELAAMPFAAWFAVTFSMRRFLIAMLVSTLAISAASPFVRDLRLLLALRLLNGVVSGALVPILMMAMLRFLPSAIRLHGLALFALTATFSPNIAVWLAALSVDRLEDWRWLYWHLAPPALIAMAMIAWGIPRLPAMTAQLRGANWFGMVLGVPGLVLMVVGIDQGVRLDWFNSPRVVAALGVGSVLTLLFLISEWLHPAPFVQLKLLARRNIWMGFVSLAGLLTVMSAGVGLPFNLLTNLQGFRPEQSAPLGLLVSLPQLVLGPCVAILLYQRWADARVVFALGLVCMGVACWLASHITGAWMVHQFRWATLFHVIGQPMAMTSMLFLIVSMVQPMEGPNLAGLVNIVRVLSTVVASAAIGEVSTQRGRFHAEMLIDQIARIVTLTPSAAPSPVPFGEVVAREAAVLASADVYRALGLLALLLVPWVLCFHKIPAPKPSIPT